MIQWNRLFLTLVAAAAIAGSFACVNVFDPIDNPSGEGQLLSAARAAFDEGDIATARELYGKVGTETATAELIFVDLDSCGADIGAFGSALSKAADNDATPGIMLSTMGGKMYPAQSTACFATLLAAYQRARAITDVNLRGFASFLAAVAIAGEVFANNTGASDGTITKEDVFTTPATCNVANGCAGCTKADGITAAAAVDLSVAATITATYGTLQGAIDGATTALGELGITSGPSTTLVAALNAGNPAVDAAYSCILSEIGVGL